MNKDKLIIGGHEFNSRFILGSGKYSLNLIEAAVKDAGAEIITLAVRRANTKEQENILDYIPEGVTLLPNTSGARTAEEAVRIARLARELGCGDFVKIEIMRDSKYLLPDNLETIKATEILANEGFIVMPYMYPDLNVARDLVNAGAATVTFAIKGIMAVIAYFIFKMLKKNIGNFPARLTGGVIAEIIMVLGYFVFEGFMYGFIPSVVNIPANSIQGVAGIVIGIILVKIFEKAKIY